MKKILIISILFLLVGCTSEYNLEISNDIFRENINVYVDKNEIPAETYEDVELDDQITPFLESKYSALFSDDTSYYKKKKLDIGEQYIVNMDYTYTAKKFDDSNSLKLCFENYEFNYEDNYYIKAYGNFFCLYSDELNINIKTNNKVIKHNADSVNGNIYTWNINSDNVENVNIEIELEKGFPYKTLTYLVIGIFVVLILLFIGYFIYNKKRKVNEI